MVTTRSSYLSRLPAYVRTNVVTAIGEFIGTWLFLFFSFAGTQFANYSALAQGAPTSTTETTLYISLIFGFSLMVNVWVFYRISGAHFNPAVTLAMLVIGAMPWTRAILYIVSQLVAGIAAAAAVSVLFPGDLAVATTLAAGTSSAQGLFIEMFLTAELVFTIFMLAGEKHKATYIAPIGIGLSLFICELTGVHFTGGSLNPARSLGPAVVLHSFPSSHWVYWLGPTMGSMLAVALYTILRKLQYQLVNPDQDSDGSYSNYADVEKATEARKSDKEEYKQTTVTCLAC